MTVTLSITYSEQTSAREVEFRKTETHIQWKYTTEADTAWRELVALSEITGEAGSNGANGSDGSNGTNGADGVTVVSMVMGSVALLGNIGWGVFFIGKKKKWF